MTQESSITPMTLGSMRMNGVRSLSVTCHALGCNHESILDMSTYPTKFRCHHFGPYAMPMQAPGRGRTAKLECARFLLANRHISSRFTTRCAAHRREAVSVGALFPAGALSIVTFGNSRARTNKKADEVGIWLSALAFWPIMMRPAPPLATTKMTGSPFQVVIGFIPMRRNSPIG